MQRFTEYLAKANQFFISDIRILVAIVDFPCLLIFLDLSFICKIICKYIRSNFGMYLLWIFSKSVRLSLNILHSDHIRNIRLCCSSWFIISKWPMGLFSQCAWCLVQCCTHLIWSLFLSCSLNIILTRIRHVPFSILGNQTWWSRYCEDETNEQVTRCKCEYNGLLKCPRLTRFQILFTSPHIRNSPWTIIITNEPWIKMELKNIKLISFDKQNLISI